MKRYVGFITTVLAAVLLASCSGPCEKENVALKEKNAALESSNMTMKMTLDSLENDTEKINPSFIASAPQQIPWKWKRNKVYQLCWKANLNARDQKINVIVHRRNSTEIIALSPENGTGSMRHLNRLLFSFDAFVSIQFVQQNGNEENPVLVLSTVNLCPPLSGGNRITVTATSSSGSNITVTIDE